MIIQYKKNSNTARKNDCNTDVRSTKVDIYNTVHEILKDSGLDTDNIEAKIDIHKQLIEKTKATRKLADNNELLSDLSNEDVTNLKMTLNELVSLITHKRIELEHVRGIESWLKHSLKL